MAMTNSDSVVQKNHFNKISEKYLSSRSLPEHLAYKHEWWNDIMKQLDKLLVDRSETVVLDAMCGNAEFSKKLLNNYQNIRVVAFDYSDEMVKKGEEKMKNYGARFKLVQEDILELNDNKKYDMVVILGGLHHVPDSCQKATENVYKSLKPGGFFLNLEPTQNNWLFRVIRNKIYHNNELFESSTERAFDLKNYNQLLKRCGFEIKWQIYPGLLGYIFYYNPDAFPRLNIGNVWTAKIASQIDLALGRTLLGKYFSFATWTIAIKNSGV